MGKRKIGMDGGWRGENEGGKREDGGCRREEGRKRKKCLFYDVFLKIWLQKYVFHSKF